MPKNIKV